MSRQEFIFLLARLVADQELTEDEARKLVAQFDNGTLPDGWQLPLAPEQAIRGRKAENEAVAAALLLLLLSKQATRLRPGMPHNTAMRIADQVQDAFAMRVAAYATMLARGETNLAAWHADVLDAIEQHLIQQMMLGNGQASLSREQLAELDRIMLTQSAFLSRFADQNAMIVGLGGVLVVWLLANRSQLYSGVGRGAFFGALEAAGVARGELGDGWVEEYVAMDDSGTCFECLNAQGYYLPGQGVFPGVVCLGRGNCRCQRTPRYLPDEYARLTGS